MGHDGTGAGWDITAPDGDSDDFRDGDDEIRDLRIGVATRLNKEHIDMAAVGVGGEHIAGAAVIYRQAAAPTTKPDGSTALAAADAGRLWLDTDDNILYVYTGSGWSPWLVPADNIATDAITNAKLADDAVDTAELADGAVDEDRLGTGAVTNVKLGADAVTTDKILDATILAGDLATDAVAQLKVGTYTGSGAAGKTVAVGFQPDFVVLTSIFNAGGDSLVFKTADMETTSAKNYAADYIADRVQITATGFTVCPIAAGQSALINVLGRVYAYVAGRMAQ